MHSILKNQKGQCAVIVGHPNVEKTVHQGRHNSRCILCHLIHHTHIHSGLYIPPLRETTQMRSRLQRAQKEQFCLVNKRNAPEQQID